MLTLILLFYRETTRNFYFDNFFIYILKKKILLYLICSDLLMIYSYSFHNLNELHKKLLMILYLSEHNKKETAITVSLQDKQCVNAIDRGNKKSYTALHIACKEGHIVSNFEIIYPKCLF